MPYLFLWFILSISLSFFLPSFRISYPSLSFFSFHHKWIKRESNTSLSCICPSFPVFVHWINLLSPSSHNAIRDLSHSSIRELLSHFKWERKWSLVISLEATSIRLTNSSLVYPLSLPLSPFPLPLFHLLLSLPFPQWGSRRGPLPIDCESDQGV